MLGWITSLSRQTDATRNHVPSQHSGQTHKFFNQSLLAMLETNHTLQLRFKRSKVYLQKQTKYNLVRYRDVYWSIDLTDRKSATGYYLKLNCCCEEASNSCSFVNRSTKSGPCKYNYSRSTVFYATSAGFSSMTKISNRNWRGQTDFIRLCQNSLMH